jgi:hypothetical protein
MRNQSNKEDEKPPLVHIDESDHRLRSRILGKWVKIIAFRPMELDAAKAQALRCNRDEAAATTESGSSAFLGRSRRTKQKQEIRARI